MKYKSLITSLVALFSFLIFSQTAYAASYINVSSGSGGTVSLGSIKPSSTGVSASGSDTLTITTNCSAGYSVYVSGQEGGDTNLTNTDKTITSSNIISASSTAVGSTATTLNSNTWGITGDSSNASASKYVGLPSYANATNKALISNSSADTSGNNKNTIYYGVKVDTTLTPGTYSGNVLYTILMDNSCLEYTLKFDDNGATTSNLPNGTSGNEYPVIPFGQAVDLSEYSTIEKISKTGYHLSGWKIKLGNNPVGDTIYPTDNNTSLDDGESSELTLIAQWEANTYTIAYNGNGASSGSVTSQINQAYGSNITLQANGFTKSGYDFLGWDLSSSATAASYKDNTSYSVSTIMDAAGKANNNGATVTLYAVWRQQLVTMQDFNCTDLVAGTSTTLRDARDDQEYTVYRIPTNNQATDVAGKCIMTKDLNLGAVDSVAGASSKITANGDMTLSEDDTHFTLPEGTDYEGVTVPTGTVAVINGTQSWGTNTYNDKRYIIGSSGYYTGRGYYSWGAAMVACPKGWRLPTDSELNDSDSANKSTSGISYAVGNSAEAIKSSPYSFALGGYYRGSYSWGNSYGLYWTSNQYNETGAQALWIHGSTLQRNGNRKFSGFSVRCIYDDNKGTMQDVSCSSLPVGQTSVLKDIRDYQNYTVYRWPTTGSGYPTDMAGYCIMTQDLNLGYVTGGSIVKGSNLVLSSDTSAGSTTATDPIYARASASDMSSVNNASNLQYHNGPQSGKEDYSSHAYYSYGAAQKVCPKGWRPPSYTEYSNIINFMGGNNSAGSSKIQSEPYNFTLGGYFYTSGHEGAGSFGHYWSSTVYNATQGYTLSIDSNSLTMGYWTVFLLTARPVRCITS